jgi:hypothetical protein
MTENICFIIAHKYNRNYDSYIKFYVDNIQKYYKDSYIIIVDNNSIYIEDIKEIFKNYKNLIILTNNIECKYELGAYKVGIQYIIDNNLINNYEFYVFTQDNFIIKNKFDFNILKNNNTNACSLYTFNKLKNEYFYPITYNILKNLNLHERIDELTLCWACSFVLNKVKIIEFFNIVKDIVVKNKFESTCCERFLSAILYYLNNYIMTSIDGDLEKNLRYDVYKVDLIKDNPGNFFVKKSQLKNEKIEE